MDDANKIRQMTHELMQCESHWVRALADVNRMCLGGCPMAVDESAVFGPLQDVLGDGQRARMVLEAHGQTRWPGTFGQSPYQEALDVVREALAGSPMWQTASRGERLFHRWCMTRMAPPAARARLDLGFSTVGMHYPRLIAAMRQGALLTQGEAEGAVLHMLRRRSEERAAMFAPSEAVQHFGGSLKAVQAAIRWRRRFLGAGRRQPQAVAA